MITVAFEGGKEIEQALFELKTATAKSLTRRVLKRAGQMLANDAAALAPENTGQLEDSYVVTTRLSRSQYRSERRAGRDDVFMYVGTNNPAGVQQEFGNARHGAQPHFRPAWDRDKNQMLKQISTDMAIEVEKAVARARRKALRAAVGG